MALDQITAEYNLNIEKSQASLRELEQSYIKTEKSGVQSTNKVAGAFQKTGGIIENLNAHLQSLERRRDKAMNPASIQTFNRKIEETRGKIQALTGQVEKSGSSITGTFKQIAASVGIAFGVQQMIRFGKELLNRALEVEEVRLAFKALNNETLLANLRNSVSGTVADLNLMRAAVKAENLGIPVERLASAFEFAERRAGALGLSTEQVIDTIIQGIGAKSTRAFTELGIDALRVQDALKGLNAETASVVDISRALGEIFSEELGKMGESVDSNSDKLERLRAKWQNVKDEISLAFLEFAVGESETTKIIQEAQAQQRFFSESTILIDDWATAIGRGVGSLNDIASAGSKAIDILKQFVAVAFSGATVGAVAETAKAVDKETESLKANRVEVDKNQEAYLRWLEVQRELAKEKERQGLVLDPETAIIPTKNAFVELSAAVDDLRTNLTTLQEQAEEGNTDAFIIQSKIAVAELVAEIEKLEGDLAVLGSLGNAFSSLYQIMASDSADFAAFQKASALFQIAVDTAQAIASAVRVALQSSTNPIQAAIQVAATIALVLANIAKAKQIIEGVEPPAFAEGEVGIQGPGTKRSDSILARVSKGESVITADGTSLDPDLLRAMNKSPHDFEQYIQHTYVWPYMEAMIKANSKQERSTGMTFNDRNILKELRKGNTLQIKATQALLQKLGQRESKRRYWRN